MTTTTAGKVKSKKNTKRQPQKKGSAGIIIAGVLALGLAGGVWALTHQSQAQLGVQFPDQGREHILVGQAHPQYNSFPPTSGWHDEATAPWGFSTQPLRQESLVHNLEHGGIVIQFRPDLDATGREALAAIARDYPTKVVVAPLPELKVQVAVTAWTRLLELDSADVAQVREFIHHYKDHAPEFFPD